MSEELPSIWAKKHLSEGVARFNAPDIGEEFIRQSNIVFPGAPPEVLMGFALNGRPNENTTGFLNGLPEEQKKGPSLPGSSVHFHELGMFGVEGGPRGGPAPGIPSRWATAANSATVMELLGRHATTKPGEWRKLPDQIAVGLVNTRTHGEAVAESLPESVRPVSKQGLWFIALSFMGWSAGDSRAAGHVQHFADRLGDSTEAKRWGLFIKLLATAGETGAISAEPARKVKHRNPFYSALRTLQKIEAGRQLCEERGTGVAFFEDDLADKRSEYHSIIQECAEFGCPRGG